MIVVALVIRLTSSTSRPNPLILAVFGTYPQKLLAVVMSMNAPTILAPFQPLATKSRLSSKMRRHWRVGPTQTTFTSEDIVKDPKWPPTSRWSKWPKSSEVSSVSADILFHLSQPCQTERLLLLKLLPLIMALIWDSCTSTEAMTKFSLPQLLKPLITASWPFLEPVILLRSATSSKVMVTLSPPMDWPTWWDLSMVKTLMIPQPKSKAAVEKETTVIKTLKIPAAMMVRPMKPTTGAKHSDIAMIPAKTQQRRRMIVTPPGTKPRMITPNQKDPKSFWAQLLPPWFLPL